LVKIYIYIAGFPKEILQLSNLRLLNIAYNQFRYYPSFVTRLADSVVVYGFCQGNPLHKSNAKQFIQLVNAKYKARKQAGSLVLQNSSVQTLLDSCAKAVLSNVQREYSMTHKIADIGAWSDIGKNEKEQQDPEQNALCALLHNAKVPPCLQRYITDGYLCDSCKAFVSPFSWKHLPALIEDLDYCAESIYDGAVRVPILLRLCQKCCEEHLLWMRYECKCAACLGAPCYTRRTTSFVVCQDF
jgi:hypothetical protein